MTRSKILLLFGCLALTFQFAQARPVDPPKPIESSQPRIYEASSTGQFTNQQRVPDAGATALLLGGALSLLAISRYSKR